MVGTAKKKKKKKLTKGQQIVKKAKKYEGKKYKAHNNAFTKRFAGKYGVKKNGCYPMGWCTFFVMAIFDMCGVLYKLPVKALGKHAGNVQYMYRWFKKHKKIRKDMKKIKPGDYLFKKVGSTKKKKPGHSEIAIAYKKGKVYSISGNVGGGMVKIRAKSPAWYCGYARVV